MRHVFTVAIVAAALLSIAAGAAKLAQTPQEVSFFAQAGLGLVPMLLLGIVQAGGGVLSIIRRYRKVGLSLVTSGFLASVVVIAMTGDFGFAAISLLPAALSGGLIYRESRRS